LGAFGHARERGKNAPNVDRDQYSHAERKKRKTEERIDRPHFARMRRDRQLVHRAFHTVGEGVEPLVGVVFERAYSHESAVHPVLVPCVDGTEQRLESAVVFAERTLRRAEIAGE
jgi:hypothetical protein